MKQAKKLNQNVQKTLKHNFLSDGTYVKEVYFEPVHKKEDGTFVEIDNTLENVSLVRSNPIYENKDGLYDFQVVGNKMQITGEEGQKLSFIHTEGNVDTYVAKENVILYSESYKNIDMEYRLGGDKVSTNFIINGKTDINSIKFTLEHPNLEMKEYDEYLDFVDKDGTSIFKYIKPSMSDANGKMANTIFSYVKHENSLEIQMELDTAWLEDSDRVFPVQLQTRASYDPVIIDMESSYIRSAQPTVTSRYHDLFVGFDDGTLNTFEYLGETRTYLHVGDLGLGSDKLILDAKLNLYKKIQITDQWNQIAVGKTAGYVNPATVNWGNKPSVITPMNVTNVRVDPGWQAFDIKSYVEDIYSGKNNTLELKATNASSSTLANVFYSESGAGLPKMTVRYKDAFDVRPDLDINTFHEYMRVFSIQNDKFYGFSFDGIAKPDSQVIFNLVEKDKDDVLLSETSKGNADRYYVDPIYITNHIAGTQTYEKKDGNYTTDYILENKIPEYDVPYEYKINVKKGTEESVLEYRSDAFVKYKVKLGDTLQTISTYYGVKVEDIKADNNLTVDTIKEDDVLLVRMKKDNPKVSKETYAPPERTIEYKAKYVTRGPRCVGTCDIIDPVNATTGNYFNETVDFTLEDFDKVEFNRYYNSTGPQISNMFGNGFTTPFESYVSYDKDGNMLYFLGDGKIYEFKKDGDKFTARNQDHFEVSKDNGIVVIKDLDTNYRYTFNVYGNLDIITTDGGKEIKVTYDEYGYITKATIGNKEITFNYNDKNLVKEIVLPNGGKTTYGYDKNRNLTEFKDVNGTITNYHYDKDNYLTYSIDKNGNKTAINTYDEEGRVSKQRDANGNVTTLSYNGKTSTVTKADGSKDEYVFDDEYNIKEIKKDGKSTYKYTYDAYGNIVKEVDADGNTINYTYDKENLMKVTYPDGTYEEYTYDGNNQVTYSRDREGKTETRSYSGFDELSVTNQNGNSTTYEYDGEHRVTKEVDIYGASKSYTYVGNQIASITYSNGLVETFEYDENGNTVKERDNQGKITTYVYNLSGEMTQKNYPDGSNEKWSYDGNGNITEYQDRLGSVATSSYDKHNNLLKTTKGTMTNSYTYDAFNNCISETDIQGNTIYYTYDTNNQKISETDVYGNKTTFEYTTQGQLLKTIDPFGNEEVNVYKNENLVESTTKEGVTTIFTYDRLNREIEKVNPNGTKETSVYNGDTLMSTTDIFGTIQEYMYDAYGREVEVKTTYPDGTSTITKKTYDAYNNIISEDVDGAITTYAYDVYNQQISIVDPLGNSTTSKYDFDGNMIEELDALGNKTLRSYNANGDMLSETDKNGNVTTKSYNANGFLLNETDAMGFVRSYSYNKKGQVIEEIDPYNTKITYTYDAYGNVIESTMDDSVIEKKTYDTYGREIEVENLEAHTSNTYDDFDRVISTKNHKTGLEVTKTYDEYGNVIKEVDSEGLETRITYDKYQRNIEQQDAYGRIQKQEYNVQGNVIKTQNFDGTVETSEYDINGNQIKQVDAKGQTTSFTYNKVNQVVSEKVGEKETTYEYDALGRSIKTLHVNNNSSESKVYDANGNVIEEVDTLGNSTKKIYNKNNLVIEETDALGNKTAKVYDAHGNIVKETNALGNTKQTLYNVFGQIEKEIDERGFAISYVYDEDHTLIETIDKNGNTSTASYNEYGQVTTETNANGGETSYVYDAYNRIIEQIEPNGKVIRTTYDALGNVIQKKDGQKVTQNTYDSFGRLQQVEVKGVVQEKNTYDQANQVVTKEDANGTISKYTYDKSGNITYQDEKGFVSENTYDVYNNLITKKENKSYLETNTYDSKGQLLSTVVNNKQILEKQYDANGNEIKVTESGLTKEFVYDGLHQPIEMKVPSVDGTEMITYQKVVYDESGNPTEEIDALGNKVERAYDANNNVISETNANGTTDIYEFDALNNLTKAQNANGRYVSYTYNDGNDLIIKQINHTYAEYEYDEQHNLTVEKNEYGYTTKYTYDALGNRTSYTKPDGVVIRYEYDKLNNKTKEGNSIFSYDKRGNLITAKNNEGTVTYTYDAFNRMTSTKDTNGKNVTYEYNKDKLLSKETYEGITVSYSYNTSGLLTRVKKNDTMVAEYTYNSRGEIISLRQGTVDTKTEYSNDGSITRKLSLKDNQTIQDTTYAYDANGNLIEEVVNGTKNTYEYNAYDELVKSKKYIDGNYITTTYAYDLQGNKTTTSSDGKKYQYTYNNKNQVESITTSKGTITYRYDKNGNVSEKINEDTSVDRYVFDDNNKLVQLIQGQYQYEYAYDAQQNRISQTKTDVKDYHYDVWYDYSVDIDVTSDEQLERGFDELRSQIKTKEDNSGICRYTDSASYDVTYYKEPEVTTYVLDRNTDYTQVLSENGKTNVYGVSLLQSGNEIQIKGLNDSIVAKVNKDKVSSIAYTDYGKTKNLNSGHGYNSEMKDETGLMYLRARYYDPEIARFIQIDNNYGGEKETVNTQNRYTYTLNNPYKYVDKDGNLSIQAAGGVAGAAGAIAGGLKWAWLQKSLKEFKKLIKKLPWFLRPIALLMWNVANTVVSKVTETSNNTQASDNGQGKNDTSKKNDNKKQPKKRNSKIKCPEEVFSSAIGYYGGDQSAPYAMWMYGSESDKKKLRNIIKKYYPKMTDNQIKKYLIKLEYEGCGYVSMANSIFVAYVNKKSDFKKKFGFDFYRTTYKGNVCNFEFLIVDIYASTDNHNPGFWPWEGDSIDYNEDHSDIDGKGTTASDQNYRFEYYVDEKNLDMEYIYTEGFLGLSEIDASVSNYNKYTKESAQLLISLNPVRIYYTNEKEHTASDGGHSVYVTGIRSDKKYFIISSWGEKLMVKVSDCQKYNYKFRIIRTT